ncbi:MAG TPA: ABC transporter permease [Chloroflexi bacterium]|nr:ABC transporter permease [Chloroflexota bacterium]
MIAVVIIFAYLLAITIFILDLAYAVVDPRIRLGSDGQHITAAQKKRSFGQKLSDFLLSVPEFFAGIRTWFSGLSAFLKVPLSFRLKSIRNGFAALGSNFWELRRYPSAIVGLLIIFILVGVSIYTIIAIPYQRAIELWTPHASEGGERIWEKYPQNAMPAWTNVFRKNKLPETIHLSSKDGSVEKTSEVIGKNMTEFLMPFIFEYSSNQFPDEISLFFESTYDEKLPFITLTWITPDEREIQLGSFSINESHILRFAFDETMKRKLGGVPPQIGLLADPNSEEPVPLKGTYELQVSAIVFEDGANVDCDFVLYGRVYGIAGTDHLRRDLSIALLWGTPVALAFGFMAAIVANLTAMIISAVSVWYGGWVDNLIQRITDVNIILPTLPIAIMVYVMYSKTIWAVLGVVVLLSIFGSSIKNYRAAFLQAKESAYVEGAIAYGASGRRIVLLYLVPRIIPVLLPQLVIMVPGFVFYEATLAFLGLSDPYLPTWGKVVYDAITNGAYHGYYYWLLEPIALLLITGLAFALLGFSLDRMVNPRLRDA